MKLASVLLLWSTVAAAQVFPKVSTENLLGKSVDLPAAAAGRTAVLVVGFSKSSQSQTKPWSVRLGREFPDPSRVVVYSVAVLESVPRLVRGMAVHGIKSSVPAEQRDRFLLVYHNENDLKRIAGFGPADDAYILLLDRTGNLVWHLHGAVSDAAVSELTSHLPPADAK